MVKNNRSFLLGVSALRDFLIALFLDNWIFFFLQKMKISKNTTIQKSQIASQSSVSSITILEPEIISLVSFKKFIIIRLKTFVIYFSDQFGEFQKFSFV